MKKFLLILFLACIIFSNCRTPQYKNLYKWEQITIGSKSQIAGILSHPKEKNLVYIRTLAGQVYRRQSQDSSWQRLNHKFDFEPSATFDVESFAIDPNNPKVLYIACSLYDYTKYCQYNFEVGTVPTKDSLQACVLKSNNYGKNWEFCGTFGLAPSRSNRFAGEKIAVDPNNSDIVYYINDNGLYSSSEGGKFNSWQRSESFAEACSFKGSPSFIIFNPHKSNNNTCSDTLYAGVQNEGMFFSVDAGATWKYLRSASNVDTRFYSYPQKPMQAVINDAGELFVSHANSLSKWDGSTWDNISPLKRLKNPIISDVQTALQSFGALAISNENSMHMLCATFNQNGKCRIFYTPDAALNWQEIPFLCNENIPFLSPSYWPTTIAAVAFDPSNPSQAYTADEFGVWKIESMQTHSSTWKLLKKGQEEFCLFDALSTPIGSPLFLGVNRTNGFRMDSLCQTPSNRFLSPNLTETTGIDFCEADPNFMARVGSWDNGNNFGSGGISVDNGKNWIPFIQFPYRAKFGKIAYSAENIGHFVWLPYDDIPYVTQDQGKTWVASRGTPLDAINEFWQCSEPLASDRVNGNIFYLYNDGSFYRSDNGALTWQQTSSMPTSTHACVQAVPFAEKNVWVCLQEKGLFISQDGGDTFKKHEDVEQAKFISFGAPAVDRDYATIFLYGKIGKNTGLFRSDNQGKRWIFINTAPLDIAREISSITADRQNFGTVYIGTYGFGCYAGKLSQ